MKPNTRKLLFGIGTVLALSALDACGGGRPATGTLPATSTSGGTTAATGGSLPGTPIGGGTTGGVAAGSTIGSATVSGTVDKKTFAAKDAVYAEDTSNPNDVNVVVVVADQNNLCTLLAGTAAPQTTLIFVQAGKLSGALSAGDYPIVDLNTVDPNNLASTGLSPTSGVASVDFFPPGAQVSEGANAGKVSIATLPATHAPFKLTFTATDAQGDTAQGQVSAAYCAALATELAQQGSSAGGNTAPAGATTGLTAGGATTGGGAATTGGGTTPPMVNGNPPTLTP